MASFGNWFAIWNRKLHYYAGLYFLFSIWLFSFTGLLLNHSWKFAEFYPHRKITNFEREFQPLGASGDAARAVELNGQLGIHGEMQNVTTTAAGRLDYTVNRPGQIYQVQADVEQRRAKVTFTEYNAWGITRILHTFSGVNITDPRVQRDWIATSVWALSMDAFAAGLLFMVFSSYYMWWGLKQKRVLGMVALGSGVILCGLFVAGLRWMFA